MQAVWYEGKGAAQEVLQYGEMGIHEMKPGEVRVRMQISGVNPSDTKGRSDWGGNTTMPFPCIIPHQDGAGIIDAVGKGVLESRVGERVWLYEAQWKRPFGTAAEYVVVPSQQAVRLPDHTDFEAGASLGVPAMTAHRCVFADGSVNGQTILVTGGAGSVGYYALQLAKWGGATVITTVSRSEQEQLVKAAGADHIINYKTENVAERIREITGTEAGRGIDRIVEVNFGANLPTTSAVLKPNGVVTSYASGGSEDQPKLPFYPLLLNSVTIRLVRVYVIPEAAKQAAVRDITAVLEAGALRSNIAKRFSLSQVAAAHDAQDSGQMIGKAVIQIA